jgi:tetratricopeptide (TPR) repeat protein
MQWLNELTCELGETEGKAISLTVPAGQQQHHEFLHGWLARMRTQGFQGWYLDCDFDKGGTWAGLTELFASLLPTLQTLAPDLLIRHDYELVSIMPNLRNTLPVRHLSLTDIASDQEQTRLYPPDRALRIVHGLIDLLAEWKARSGQSRWLMVCDSFDRAGNLASTFFTELLHRRGVALRLTLVLVTVGEKEIRQSQGDPLAALEAASLLEAECVGDPDLTEERLPRLIRLWTLAGNEEKAFAWRTQAFTRYTLRGYYREALAHGNIAMRFVLEHMPGDEQRLASIINKLYSCYCAVGEPYKALELLEIDAFPKLTGAQTRAHFFYQLAMLYTRFLSESDRDFRKAEASLDEGLAELLAAEMPETARQFSITFNRNGLALVRHRQGRFQDAIALCREGYDRLSRYLGDGEHRLHRSVLLYNVAQVYAAMGCLEEALSHFDAAIGLDPSYSEYFNERGNAYFRLQKFEEALADYQQALELSPPYAEVFINLGQCLRAMGQYEVALEAYNRALDLKPDQNWVFVMRGECHEALGSLDAALDNYTQALSLDPTQFAVFANRAYVHHALGQPQRALADLDRAIEISPETAELYQNRAAALQECGQSHRAVLDLEKYLNLCPNAADASEVLSRLRALRGLTLSGNPTSGQVAAQA